MKSLYVIFLLAITTNFFVLSQEDDKDSIHYLTLSEARNTVESDDKVAKRQAIVDNAIELMPLQSRPTAV